MARSRIVPLLVLPLAFALSGGCLMKPSVFPVDAEGHRGLPLSITVLNTFPAEASFDERFPPPEAGDVVTIDFEGRFSRSPFSIFGCPEVEPGMVYRMNGAELDTGRLGGPRQGRIVPTWRCANIEFDDMRGAVHAAYHETWTFEVEDEHATLEARWDVVLDNPVAIELVSCDFASCHLEPAYADPGPPYEPPADSDGSWQREVDTD
jgi:hypothetical protein